MKEITDLYQVIQEPQWGIVNPQRARQMLDGLVIDISYECSLACRNCNRLCGIFPRRGRISLERVESMVRESISLEKKWINSYSNHTTEGAFGKTRRQTI